MFSIHFAYVPMIVVKDPIEVIRVWLQKQTLKVLPSVSHSLNCCSYYRCAQILTILFFLVLKMDVERFEFDVLSSMLARSMWPEQIMMEVHWATRMVDVSTMLRIIQAAELSLFFGMLFTHGG